jgi:major type 1 subunit fimbrin (pilin)
MNSFKLKLAVTALALGGFVSVANAADGSVHFTGEITATACEVKNGSGGVIAVSLGKVAKKSLPTKGTKSSSVPFEIELDKCPSGKANVRFDGTADSIDKTLLALDGSSTATGVGIEIDSDTGVQIPMYAPSADITLTANNNTLHYMARYVATNANVTAGLVDATSQFTIIYK